MRIIAKILCTLVIGHAAYASEAWHDGLGLDGSGASDYSPRFVEAALPQHPDGRWILSLGDRATLHLTVRDGAVGDGIWLHEGDAVRNNRNWRWIIDLRNGQLTARLQSTDGAGYLITADVAGDGSLTNGAWQWRQEHDSSTADASGSVSAQSVTWTDAAAQETPIIGEQWPAWGGPSGNYISEPQGHQLIANLSELRPIWRSEAVLPSGIGSISRADTRTNCRKQPHGGGAASPILADGRIFVATFRPGSVIGPAIDLYDEAFYDNGESIFERYHRVWGPTFGARAEAHERQRWAIDAADMVVAIDAATGRTLWQTELPGAANTQEHKGGYNNFTPCYYQGRVYAQGITRRLFCLDAETGAVLWYNDPAANLEASLQSSLETGTYNLPFFGGRGRWGHEAPLVIDDRLIIARNGLECYDPDTGTRLWRVGDVIDRVPAVWRHGGETFLLACDSARAVIRCFAMDGSEVWSDSEAIVNGLASHLLAVDGNTVAFIEGNQDDALTTFVIGTLSRDGLTVEHRIDRTETNSNFMPPVIRDGVLAAATDDATVLIDVTTGATIAHTDTIATSLNGHIQRMEDRLLVLGDNHHGDNDMMWTGATVDTFSDTSTRNPPHYTTSPYTGSPWNQVYGDGRLFIRGSDGIYAYDLRAASARSNTTPQARFTIDTVHGVAPLTVQVDASASSDDDGDACTYAWAFAASEASGANASHTFTTAGRYLVRLTVTDEHGLSSYRDRWVVVAGDTGNHDPIARISVDQRRGRIPFTVHLDASASYDIDHDTLSFAWAFPDGSQATGPTASYRAPFSGNQVIELTVSDGQGGTATASVTVSGGTLDAVNTIWHETFDGLANGTTTDTGDTAWSATGSGSVRDDTFHAQQAKPAAVLTTETIAIDGLTNPAINVTLRTTTPGEMEWADYAEVAYAIDGGDFVVSHRLNGAIAGGSAHTVTALLPVGSTAQVRVTLSNSSSAEITRCESIQLFDSDPMQLNRNIQLQRQEGWLWNLLAPVEGAELLGNTDHQEWAIPAGVDCVLAVTPAWDS